MHSTGTKFCRSLQDARSRLRNLDQGEEDSDDGFSEGGGTSRNTTRGIHGQICPPSYDLLHENCVFRLSNLAEGRHCCLLRGAVRSSCRGGNTCRGPSGDYPCCTWPLRRRTGESTPGAKEQPEKGVNLCKQRLNQSVHGGHVRCRAWPRMSGLGRSEVPVWHIRERFKGVLGASPEALHLPAALKELALNELNTCRNCRTARS